MLMYVDSSIPILSGSVVMYVTRVVAKRFYRTQIPFAPQEIDATNVKRDDGEIEKTHEIYSFVFPLLLSISLRTLSSTSLETFSRTSRSIFSRISRSVSTCFTLSPRTVPSRGDFFTAWGPLAPGKPKKLSPGCAGFTFTSGIPKYSLTCGCLKYVDGKLNNGKEFTVLFTDNNHY